MSSDQSIYIFRAQESQLSATIRDTYNGEYVWALAEESEWSQIKIGDICILGQFTKTFGFKFIGIVIGKRPLLENEHVWPASYRESYLISLTVQPCSISACDMRRALGKSRAGFAIADTRRVPHKHRGAVMALIAKSCVTDDAPTDVTDDAHDTPADTLATPVVPPDGHFAAPKFLDMVGPMVALMREMALAQPTTLQEIKKDDINPRQ